jgi:hypothetical protein
MNPSTPILDALVAESAYPPMQRIATQEPLTKRERFAMAAMQGLCANREWFQWDFARVAQMARIQADDLIAELKANPEPE